MAAVPKVTFYKRPLPVPPAVEFSSADGRKLFQDALLGGTCEGFFKLIEQFMTQDEPSFCGLASIAMVLNALAIDPRRPWRGAWRYFHDTMLDCCLPLETIKQQGTTLEQAACLARCNGAEVSFHRYGTFSVDNFRKQVQEVCRTGSSHIVVSYSRRTFLQTGDGHFSPIGAYHAEKDLVLILDVARFKYPPHWVPLPMLVEAMSFHDTSTQRPRGYMVLSPRAPIPVAFTLDISNPSAVAYSSALRFLDTHVPKLHASLQACDSNDPQQVMSALLRIIPLEGADVLLAIRSKALVQDVHNPGSCGICNPLLHHAQQQQQQQQHSEHLHTQNLEQQHQQHQDNQQQQDGAALPTTGGCRGNGAYCSESGCSKKAMLRTTASHLHHMHTYTMHTYMHMHTYTTCTRTPHASHLHHMHTSTPLGKGNFASSQKEGGSGEKDGSDQSQQSSQQSSVNVEAASSSACSAGSCQAGSGGSNCCSSTDSGGGGSAATLTSGTSSGDNAHDTGGGCRENGGGGYGVAPKGQEGLPDAEACASGEQDPVIQELRTTDLFKVIQDHLCTKHEESRPTPLQDYLHAKQQRLSESLLPQGLHQIQEQQLQPQQQQQQGAGMHGLGTDQQPQQHQHQQQQQQSSQGCGSRQVCTLHMVSKVAMLLWLAGLEKWEGLWQMGTPEKRQWWLWFGKPLETLPLMSQEVKYLRIQLQEVQKLLQLQGEQSLGTVNE